MDPLARTHLSDPEWELARSAAYATAREVLTDCDGSPDQYEAALRAYQSRWGFSPRWAGIFRAALSAHRSNHSNRRNPS